MADIDGFWWDKIGFSYDVGFANFSVHVSAGVCVCDCKQLLRNNIVCALIIF